MNASRPIRALIAEDEPILAAILAQSLQRLWPGLEIAATAPNGLAAVEQALALRPEVLFLDIKMPGQSGLEAAEELAERWDGPQPFPEIVFVTAYDDYALKAFEQAAADYVLKPVSDERLRRTVERLQLRLDVRQDGGGLARLVEQMRALLPQASAPERLSTIRAAVGNVVRVIPVQDVVYFQALDKYVNVATADSDALIRLPLKELMAQLDPLQFCQVSRSSIVNMRQVASASRDETGKLSLALRGRSDRLKVSPLFAHLFKQM
ncbi:Transcriptional regulatory protein YehT [Massilia sp. Bi118]|uniref:LytR/AlgR family response regulator transcription factor n=1 Tax=Massilia sp. Bi118 TaxID=2822346 RepID=UPI001D637A2A|nr:LytTR family DNA-binding domain-containing protein [Massilia sp. Bi118]CAH0281818.1 Transcriptional regulatory protein YehT [Massilia sp. Bi118]